jgi:phosphoribosylglycinamide formyltransferase-1
MINVEIWASGGGTNADAVINYFASFNDINVVNIGCNRRVAGAFQVADKHNIASSYWNKENWNSESILMELKDRNVDFIVLAGFLKLVPSSVTKAYEGRMVNIHPSLLPQYGGKNMFGEHVHRAVLANKEEKTGITIHEVNEEFDKGKVLAQFSVALNRETDDLNSIKQKIQRIEHSNFAPTIESWIRSKY